MRRLAAAPAMNRSGFAAAALALLLAACAPTIARTAADATEPLLASLTLEEKVGQLFMIGGNASFMNEESTGFKALAHQVVDNKVGGVIWFRSQVYETALLNARLQEMARLPLLIAADLEAGAGMRFDDVTYGPWAMAVAATGDPTLAERRARATAEEARALGVTQVYAPVADVNVNPDNPVINVRSFGEDPEDVARYVAAAVKGLESGGVLSTLKHFPGHGETSVDSHCALPIMKADRRRLDTVELVPFRAGIAAGASSVMVAHLAVPALDGEPAPLLPDAARSSDCTSDSAADRADAIVPATLSSRITTGLLRKELRFDGLIVTDAMRMGGIVAHYEAGEAAVRAILAGQDQILLPAEPDRAIAAVVAAVKAGRIPESRIDESARRVLAAKRRLGLFERRSPPVDRISKVVGSPEHEAVEAEIARRSLTLVREEPGVLPLDPGKSLALVVIADEPTRDGPAGPLVAALRKRLGTAAPRPAAAREAPPAEVGQPQRRGEILILDPRSTSEDVRAAVDAARKADAILLALYVRARSGSGQIAIPAPGKAAVPLLAALGKPVVAVSFGSPYLLRELPEIQTYVCAYGVQDVVQTAAAQALYGEAPFTGRLPVTIPGFAPRGTGIQKSGR